MKIKMPKLKNSKKDKIVKLTKEQQEIAEKVKFWEEQMNYNKGFTRVLKSHDDAIKEIKEKIEIFKDKETGETGEPVKQNTVPIKLISIIAIVLSAISIIMQLN